MSHRQKTYEENAFHFNCRKKTKCLVVSEELDANPAPQVEEDIDRDGDGQQQAVETHAVPAGATLREVLVHCGRVEQTTQRQKGDQSHHQWQSEHSHPITARFCLVYFSGC